MGPYARSVFLNVPFDTRYRKLFDALVFGVHDCGFTARCAQESDDGGQVRLDKLFGIIAGCRLGIHDLSRTTLDAKNRLPRFNMPLELGLFLGARRFGPPAQRRKSSLILEREKYRYQIFCSDISGQDIRAHHNDAYNALAAVRNWLQATHSSKQVFPGAGKIASRYIEFRKQLPFMCTNENLTPRELTFLDFRRLVDAWITVNPG